MTPIEVTTGDILGRPGHGRREKAIVCSDDPTKPFIVFLELSIGDGAWRGTVSTTPITFDRFDKEKGYIYTIREGNWQVDEPLWE